MPSDENEKKGRVYEAFVKLAFELVYESTILWEPDLPGVLANQDLVYPSVDKPEVVIAVTYWGSHEAANKKFWRTIEDRFEVLCAYPEAGFLSIVFEKNQGSDDALDDILHKVCLGLALSERNSKAIIHLQRYVENDESITQFGSGKDAVFYSCKSLYKTDKTFRTLIDILGQEIFSAIHTERGEYEQHYNFMLNGMKPVLLRNGTIAISGIRNTYYKLGLIKLLRFTPDEIGKAIESVKENKWKSLDQSLIDKLEDAGLIRCRGIARIIEPSDELLSIVSLGVDGYKRISKQVEYLVESQDSDSDFSAYSDHYFDITSYERREHLYDLFKQADCVEELKRLEHGDERFYTQRVWIVDYYLALKRALLHGKYGAKKLSLKIGLPYIGGISPLPNYVAGRSILPAGKEELLYQTILSDKQTFDFTQLGSITILHDRTTTLMKKFDIIELLISNAFSRAGIEKDRITRNFTVKTPFAMETSNNAAGSTEFNFVVRCQTYHAFIFVVSAYDASHKHKEIAGRARFLRLSDEWKEKKIKTIVVMDGKLLDGSPDKKLLIMYKAGWDYAFYVDELEMLIDTLHTL